MPDKPKLTLLHFPTRSPNDTRVQSLRQNRECLKHGKRGCGCCHPADLIRPAVALRRAA